jgi:hypothetical protein
VNGPDVSSGVQESWNIAAGTRITDTLGTINPVPEPSTLGLAGVGVALAGFGAWKRRAAAAAQAG